MLAEVDHGHSNVGDSYGGVSTSEELVQGIMDEGVLCLQSQGHV